MRKTSELSFCKYCDVSMRFKHQDWTVKWILLGFGMLGFLVGSCMIGLCCDGIYLSF